MTAPIRPLTLCLALFLLASCGGEDAPNGKSSAEQAPPQTPPVSKPMPPDRTVPTPQRSMPSCKR